jgi:cytosine deaminase
VVDGRGHLTLPGLVDAHAHLDKTPLGPALATPHRGRGRPGGADRQRAPRPGRAGPSGITVAQRAGNLLGAYVAAGTSHIRSHVDVDPDLGLTSLQGVMEARAAFADQISVELVAFPETGLLVRPGTARAAGGGRTGRRGADRRPGPGRLRPPVHRAPGHHLRHRGRHGCGLDIHHGGGELVAFTIDLILERTRALGLASKVTTATPRPRRRSPRRGWTAWSRAWPPSASR